jgi:two-component system OmpR family response regulator/two-component system response regulator QseB
VLGDGLCAGLRQQGFQVDWVRDGVAALRELGSEGYAAAVLDLGLPRLDGLDVLRQARQTGVRTPVLVLTARDAVPQRIEGLDNGADDYVVKPIDLDELAARLRALVRRASGQAQPLLQSHDVQLDLASRQALLAGAPVVLSTREFDLLEVLMRNAGRVLTREQLEQQLYRWGHEVDSNAVEVHVHHLRRKLGAALIQTVRGVGYLVPKA